MTRHLAWITALAALTTASFARAQSPATADTPTFEVASVQPNKSADLGGSFRTRPGGQFAVTNNTLRNIIRNAYQLQDFQIVGGPDWLDRDRFDITAKTPTPEPTMPQVMAMVQALLAERFKFVAHRETREMPIYALVVARPDGVLGPRLSHSATDCGARAAAARNGAGVPPVAPDGRPLCGTRFTPGRVLAGGITMADLARNLSNAAGRVTVDTTGLAGGFDLELEFTPDQLPPEGTLPPGMPRPPVDGPSLFAALQEQLGLKLESQRGPVDVLVIDSVEPPSPD